MQSGASHEKIPLDFFALVFLISIPFWLFGGSRLPLPVTLPVSALMVFNPLIAASILSYRRNGLSGVKELVKKAIDYKKIKKIWYLPTLLLIPLIYALAYIVMRFAGLPLPAVPEIPLLAAPVFFILYFITATGEELGWMGYAIQPMQNRWGALKASIILGLVWSIWHAIPDVQAQHSADWILWHRIYSVALRILIVWIFN
ncbi:MAG: CPBP family intramembrane metalloprotease, partial [Chloroflexota bacterium]